MTKKRQTAPSTTVALTSTNTTTVTDTVAHKQVFTGETLLCILTPNGIDELKPSEIRTIARTVVPFASTCRTFLKVCQPILLKLRTAYEILSKYGNYNYVWEADRIWSHARLDVHPNSTGNRVFACPAIFDLLGNGTTAIERDKREIQNFDCTNMKQDVMTIISTHPSALKFDSGEMFWRRGVTCFEVAIRNRNIPLEFIQFLIDIGMPVPTHSDCYGTQIDFVESLKDLDSTAHKRFQHLFWEE